ncbi:hypothetical protein [Bradyrhizobium sp. 6(2017)]|uniref:hypothetical protein n=1 Tax=Bradyrhizobium sp. 6(2017) TaxID=1197460 RepID=UPI0013E20327|nr:hypothetical protein [Bradyrhizobium sp. 6(2017)]QIG97335.1 hypothetical protein G6P99_36415 [Bradyrhizobium sp. 6(2017)]
MLNEAGGYGTGDEGEHETPSDAEQIFDKLQKWCKADFNSKGQVKWRREAREDFDFEAGEQLSEDDKRILEDANLRTCPRASVAGRWNSRARPTVVSWPRQR